MPTNSSSRQKNLHLRWWPAIAIIILASLATLFIWLFAFSRLSRKIRLFAFGALVLLLGLGLALFRMRGASGDVLPVLEWRFAKNEIEPLSKNSSEPADTAATMVPEPPAQEESQPQITSEISKPASEKPITSLRRDYPQFLGPNRDAKVSGIKLNRDWTKHPPQRLWRQNLGAGWSSFAVAGNFAVTQEQRGEIEMVVAYDLTSGHVKWSHGDSTGFASPITGDGPRATPTIAQNRVYTQGATGMLNCLDLKTGKRIWSKNILQDNEAPMKEWGIAGSPLVLDGLQVSLIWETNKLKAKFTNVVHRDGYIYGLDDGILVCLDLTNGERKWKAGRYGHGQLINADDLLLVQAESGDVLLVEATPDAHKEVSRFAALAGKTWNNPALAGEYLLVRNDREAACYQLALE